MAYLEVMYLELCKEISKVLDELTPSMLLKRIIDEFNFYEKFILVGNVDCWHKENELFVRVELKMWKV